MVTASIVWGELTPPRSCPVVFNVTKIAPRNTTLQTVPKLRDSPDSPPAMPNSWVLTFPIIRLRLLLWNIPIPTPNPAILTANPKLVDRWSTLWNEPKQTTIITMPNVLTRAGWVRSASAPPNGEAISKNIAGMVRKTPILVGPIPTISATKNGSTNQFTKIARYIRKLQISPSDTARLRNNPLGINGFDMVTCRLSKQQNVISDDAK